ncbi:MAG: long-chain fatty acid--CoA ligase [Alphaproteobacteria bacterium]|nr:long-chain fatty acid--CoA ligase [Alphaproteobacteria bacterium]
MSARAAKGRNNARKRPAREQGARPDLPIAPRSESGHNSARQERGYVPSSWFFVRADPSPQRRGPAVTEPFWEKSYPSGVKWKQTIPEAPVWAIVDDAARRFGHRPAIEFMGRGWTYADLDALIDHAAKGFRALGVGPGVHVGLFLPNTPHYIICFFAILKAGGRVVNYSPLDAERELRFKIENSRTDIVVTLSLNALYSVMGKMLGSTRLKKIVVCTLPEVLPFPKNLLFPLLKRAQIARVPQDDRHVPFARLIDNDGVYTPHVVKDPKTEVAVLQYTGGTTGEPKGAMLTHYNLMAAMVGYRAFTQGDKPMVIEGEERALVVLPMFHIYGLSAVMLRLLAGGAELVLHPRFELQAVLKDLHAKKITCMAGVPTMYAAIVNAPDIGKYDLSALKLCNAGGAPLPGEVQEKFRRLTGCYLSEGWGMTETSPLGTWKPDTGGGKKGSCGLPLPNVTIEVVDVDDPLKLLKVGERGEICITGPNLMVGYWNNPAATEEAFAGGRFHTGDIGRIDEDGFVFLVDRKKDMILSGGFNVYPRNIEEAIYEHPAVAECTVIGIPDDYRGQSAKAFIKLREGAAPFSFEELKAFLAPKLGKHEMPTAIDIRAQLPKTAIGKLSKKELVEEERNASAARKAAGAHPEKTP